MINDDSPASAPTARPCGRSSLECPLADGEPFGADFDPCGVHHREHVPHSLLLFANQVAHRLVELDDASG
jgi:hypothetical protein